MSEKLLSIARDLQEIQQLLSECGYHGFAEDIGELVVRAMEAAEGEK